MQKSRFLAVATVTIACSQLVAARVQANEPGWAGPGWYIWNKAIRAPALTTKKGASAGPYPTKEACEAARPDGASHAQAIPIFECIDFASEAEFERKLEEY